MATKGYARVQIEDVDGFQHAEDDYWLQPIVFGQHLYTYVASVPPGGFMPPHGHEEDPYELSFFQIDGELEVTLEDDTFTARPGTALHIEPGVSLGVQNKSHGTARFVLTFNPPPRTGSLDRMRKAFVEAGRRVKSPEEMQEMLSGRK